MIMPFKPAKEVAKTRSANGFWIDHAIIREEDFDWLADVERLTLWNVKIPPGFLAKLRKLWCLDIRGGSSTDISIAERANELKYLAVNQVRGLSNLSGLTAFKKLQMLSIYGLSKVIHLPSLHGLIDLQRAEVGQMKSLTSIIPILSAPNLKELELSRMLNVSQTDALKIAAHPSLESFNWFAIGVPIKIWAPVVESIHLPKARSLHPEEWFGLQTFAPSYI